MNLGHVFRDNALAQVGKRKWFGREGVWALGEIDPRYFYPAQLVTWLFFHMTFHVPDTIEAQFEHSVPLPSGSTLRIGDLAFIGTRRVAVYVGRGVWVEARGPYSGVSRLETPQVKREGASFRRFTTDLAARPIVFDVMATEGGEVFYWVLAHCPGREANVIIRDCVAKDIPVTHKLSTRAQQRFVKEAADRLPR
jgi:hypothetical protein